MNIHLNIIEKILMLFSNDLLDDITLFIVDSSNTKKSIYIQWRLSFKNLIVFGGSGNVGQNYEFPHVLLDSINSYDYQKKLDILFHENLDENEDFTYLNLINGLAIHKSNYMNVLEKFYGNYHIEHVRALNRLKEIKLPESTGIDTKKTKL